METERFARLRDIVLAAERLSGPDRTAYLEAECRDDPEMREEAESLLRWDDPAGLESWRALRSGSLFDHYRLVEEIGAGGMGVVWRARDTKLDRDVAIKFLPGALAEDPVSTARFEREAKVVASLNHPHLLAIHEFHRDGGMMYSVTELLDGESLRRRLQAGPLPPRKASELGAQIARGLAAAHARGIVHRDLKPENVFLTREGRVKILDFGLASLRPRADQEAPGHDSRLSTPGLVFGTAAYMSPEQARGDVVDPRSDIFSLGIVLQEMISGNNPFERDTNAETLAAILVDDPPDLTESRRPVPHALARAVARCLEKRPDERFQSAADLAFALETASGAPIGPARRTAGSTAASIGWATAGALVLVAALGSSLLLRPRGSGPPAAPPRIRTLTFSGSDGWPAASPDGRTVAFSSERDGRARIWIKDLGTGGEQPVTDGDDLMPSFSPDGASLLFVRAEGNTGSLYRQALVGGAPRRLVRDVVDGRWSPDGRRVAFLRVLSSDQGWTMAIGVADSRSGSEQLVAESRQRLFGVGWTADGREVFATETVPRGHEPEFSLLLADPATGRIRHQRIQHTETGVSAAVWNGNGRDLLFARSGSLVGDQGGAMCRVVSYQPASGHEKTLFYAEHLFPSVGGSARPGRLAIVSRGTLAFASATVRENLVEFPANTQVETMTRLTRGDTRDRQPAYSQDGKHILFASNRSGNLDLWMADVERSELHQITDDPAQDWDPAFTPDGNRILWSSNRSGHLEIWMAATDGSGAHQVSHDGFDAENPSMTPDGQWILYWSSHVGRAGLWKVRTDGSHPTLIVAGQYALPEISPDGRWASYLVLEPNTLRNVIRVVAFADGTPLPFEILVPAPFNRPDDVILGRHRWLPDGSGIAYVGCDDRGHTDLFVQGFKPGIELGKRSRIPLGRALDTDIESFALSPDGRKVVAGLLDASRHVMLAEGVAGVYPNH